MNVLRGGHCLPYRNEWMLADEQVFRAEPQIQTKLGLTQSIASRFAERQFIACFCATIPVGAISRSRREFYRTGSTMGLLSCSLFGRLIANRSFDPALGLSRGGGISIKVCTLR